MSLLKTLSLKSDKYKENLYLYNPGRPIEPAVPPPMCDGNRSRVGENDCHPPAGAVTEQQKPVCRNTSQNQRRGRVALVDRLTASPVMHPPRVRTSLSLCGFSGDHVNGGLVELKLRPVYQLPFFARPCAALSSN